MYGVETHVREVSKRAIKNRVVRSYLADIRWNREDESHLSEGNVNKLIAHQKVNTIRMCLITLIQFEYTDKMDIMSRCQDSVSHLAQKVADDLIENNDWLEGGR